MKAKKFYQSVLSLVTAGVVATLPCASVFATSQDETVYAKLQSNGSVQNISVTEHLINDLSDAQILDKTILTELENLNGYEGYILDGDRVTWDAQGKDIYYRGKATKELPIKLAITYKLDGEEKTLDEILGKNGHVEIELKYTNSSRVGDLYTPFVAAVATTLSEEKVKNVEVTNGKATSNGRTVAVAAIAAPGLYESLGLDELKNADKVTISYDTENFELSDIYTIVTPKLLDSADLKTFTQLDELYTSANQLASSSKQLVNGSQNLQNGIRELRNAVAQAKSKLENTSTTLNAEQLAQIKNLAAKTAEQKVEAQRQTIAAGVKAQLNNNAELKAALRPFAEQQCSAQIGGASCPDAAVDAIVVQILQNMTTTMTESSVALAKQTAVETATATAEQTATQVASKVGETLMPTVAKALDSMLGGIDKIASGAGELNSGMAKFDREGIQPLAKFVNGQVKVTSEKIECLIELGEHYNNYAGIADGMEGATKFVMMVEGKKEE